ncbi:MAG: hypothetical protein AAFX05_08220, partial [Planctomycetota bacterium]
MERPPKWSSSLVAFRYDPSDEFQSIEGCTISYVKVVVTVTPYAPEIDVGKVKKYVPPVLVSELEEAFPCYGAILQVSVTPTRRDRDRFTKSQYPYFADFEPKKRELYEAVTDTGEVLSASSSSLAVGKSAATSDSTENYNLDLGWNFGVSGAVKGSGGGLSIGDQKQVGDVYRSGLQRQNIRTSEQSVERRERQSHTTQLTQMYNLFQAFHLGTNRAVFFMEPRPHIRQSEATFINGPRALEGTQEIFMVIVRPEEMEDFCLGALLETAHLTKEPVYEYETTTDTLEFRLFANAENKDTSMGKTNWVETVTHTETYTPPPGWEIDTSRNGGYSYSVLRSKRRRRGPIFSVTPSSMTVFGEVTWRFWETGFWHDDNYEDGYLDVDVTVYLRKKEPILREIVRKLFLSARDLCCCEGELPFSPVWIPWDKKLPLSAQVMVHSGVLNRRAFVDSRRLASAVRDGMVQSLATSFRSDRGAVAYQESDLLLDRAASLLKLHRPTAESAKPVKDSKVVPKKERERLHEKLGAISVDAVMDMPARDLAIALE